MQTTLLFDSVYSAQEVAFILRGLWDECNAVTFTDFNEYDLAFKTAVRVASAEYCHQDDSCYISSAPVLIEDKYQLINELCRNGNKEQKLKYKPILAGQSLDFLIKENFLSSKSASIAKALVESSQIHDVELTRLLEEFFTEAKRVF